MGFLAAPFRFGVFLAARLAVVPSSRLPRSKCRPLTTDYARGSPGDEHHAAPADRRQAPDDPGSVSGRSKRRGLPAEVKQVPRLVAVVGGDVHVDAGRGDVGVACGIADLGQASAAR